MPRRHLPWHRDTLVALEPGDYPGSSPARISKKESKAEPIEESLPALSPTPASPQKMVLTPRARRYERILDSDPIRSPSTSPPPAPPTECLMIPGPLQDDKYRMVEDEFLHIAQRFTAHLHRAEYDRLKTLAKRQNAESIRQIKRPVVAMDPTLTAKRRRAAINRVSKQRKALGDTGVQGDGPSKLPWAGTSLHGLMQRPGRQSSLVATFPVGGLRTRAAAGFGSTRSSQQGLESSEALGRTPRQEPQEPVRRNSLTQTPARAPPMRAMRTPSNSSPQLPRPHNSANLTRHIPPPTSYSAPRPSQSRDFTPSNNRREPRRNQPGLDIEEDGDDDLFGFNTRRLNRQKSREQFKKPESRNPDDNDPAKKFSADTIPLFL